MSFDAKSPDPVSEQLQEEGYPPPTVPSPDQSVGGLPPGEGRWPLPQFTTFGQIVNQVSRTYRWTFDEATKHSDPNKLAIRRDPMIMEALRTRQMPTAQLAWHIEPLVQSDTRQVQAAKKVTEVIQMMPRFQQFLMSLLEALWYGRYGVQVIYRWDFSTGEKRLVVADHRPVNGDKLIFKWSGAVGILVHAAYYQGDVQITDRGRAHFFTPSEREQLVIHRHEPEDADFYEGDMAGAIHGVGIRGRIYWMWWLKNQVMTWMMDYLERVGAGGFTIYFYEAGNPDSMVEVQNAAQTQVTNNVIMFPRYKDSSTGGPGIERIEPNNAGAQLLGSLITDYFDKTIRRYILGEQVTDGDGMQIGSGAEELDSATIGRRIKYDAINVQESITQDLLSVLYRYNCPGVPPGKFIFDVDKPNAKEFLEAAKTFWEMGGQVDEDELRSILGLSTPGPGHNVLAQMSPMSPAGIGAMPTGVPMSGQPGPQPGPGGEPGVNPTGDPPPEETPSQDGEPLLFARAGRPVRYAAKLQPHPVVLKHAHGYLESAALPTGLDVEYKPLDQTRGKSIAQTYDQLPHDPENPKVKSAYDAFKRETLAQFHHLAEQGVKMEPWKEPGQPYANSQEMATDARNNRHLYFFTGGDFPKGHPLDTPTGIQMGGRTLTHNDVFRAVHDYFGHALYGNQFGPRGEEHAYRVHSRMYSDKARPAMAMETRGQNSWVNFGPHSHLPATERPYAEQKANVLPDHLVNDEPVKKGFSRRGPVRKYAAPVPSMSGPRETPEQPAPALNLEPPGQEELHDKDLVPYPEEELHKKAEDASRSVLSQFGDAFRQVGKPARWMKDKADKIFKSMEQRYGRKTALAIMASGQLFGWGLTGAGAAMGVPIWAPGSTIWGTAPGVGLAELYLQAKKGLSKIFRYSMGPVTEETLSPRQIAVLGKRLVHHLQAEWNRVTPDKKKYDKSQWGQTDLFGSNDIPGVPREGPWVGAGGAFINGQFYMGGAALPMDQVATLPKKQQKHLLTHAIKNYNDAVRVFVDYPVRTKKQQETAPIPQYGKAQKLGPVPEWDEVKSYLTDDEFRDMTDAAIRHAVDVFHRSVPAETIATAALGGQAKRDWYKNYAQEAAKLFGEETPRFNTLLAATSPRADPRDNLLKSLHLWGAWREAGSPTNPKKIQQILEQEAAAGRVKSFRTHDINAIRALSHPDPGTREKVLGNEGGGYKTDNYRQNLNGHFDRVTNDMWQALLGGIPHGDISGRGGYAGLTAKTRQATDILNRTREKGERPWDPSDVQAASWSFIRTLARMQARSRVEHGQVPLGQVESLAATTHRDIKSTSDYLTLLRSDPHVGQLFQRAGVSGRSGTDGGPPTGTSGGTQTQENQPAAESARRIEGSQGHLESIARTASLGIGGFLRKNRLSRTGRPVKYASGQEGVVTDPPPDDQSPSSGQSFVAASPNTDENLSFEQAQSRVRSGNQAQFRKLSNHILDTIGLKNYKSFDAIGDWNDGAENSVLQVINGAKDPRQVDYAAAWYGLLGHQKSVLTFHSDPNGPDSVYQIPVQETDTAKIRDQLNSHGIHFRTIVPTTTGHLVVVVDQGRTLRPYIARFAEEHDAPIREATGKTNFIGGSTRAEARSRFRDAIREHESRQSVHSRYRPPVQSDPAGTPTRFAAGPRGPVKAPAQGFVQRGVYYPGGEFLPKPFSASSRTPPSGQGDDDDGPDDRPPRTVTINHKKKPSATPAKYAGEEPSLGAELRANDRRFKTSSMPSKVPSGPGPHGHDDVTPSFQGRPTQESLRPAHQPPNYSQPDSGVEHDPEFNQWRKAIRETRDPDTHDVYADWLEERGMTNTARPFREYAKQRRRMTPEQQYDEDYEVAHERASREVHSRLLQEDPFHDFWNEDANQAFHDQVGRRQREILRQWGHNPPPD